MAKEQLGSDDRDDWELQVPYEDTVERLKEFKAGEEVKEYREQYKTFLKQANTFLSKVCGFEQAKIVGDPVTVGSYVVLFRVSRIAGTLLMEHVQALVKHGGEGLEQLHGLGLKSIASQEKLICLTEGGKARQGGSDVPLASMSELALETGENSESLKDSEASKIVGIFNALKTMSYALNCSRMSSGSNDVRYLSFFPSKPHPS